MRYSILLAALCLLTQSLFAQAPAGVNTLGDSITVGFGVSNPTVNGYAYLMAPSFGGTMTQYAVSGDQSADQNWVQAYPKIANTGSVPAVTILIGTNDANHAGTGTNVEFTFNRTLLSMSAWLAIPRSAKVFAQDSACTKTGSWSAENSPTSGVGEVSNTLGDSISCVVPVNSSGVLYANWSESDGTGGTMSVTIDGSTPGNDATFASTPPGGSCICTQNSTTQAVFLARYTGLSTGNHTIKLTVTSATSGSSPNYPMWFGSPFTTSSSTPQVYVGGVIYQENDTDSTATSEYNSDVATDATTLAGDGLPVVYVNVRNYVNSSTDMQAGSPLPPPIAAGSCAASTSPGLHPNNCGMEHLALAFESALPQNPPTPISAPSSSLFASTVTLPAGQSLSFTAYDPTSIVKSGANENLYPHGWAWEQLNHNADGTWSLCDGNGNPCAASICGTLTQQTVTSAYYTPPGIALLPAPFVTGLTVL